MRAGEAGLDIPDMKRAGGGRMQKAFPSDPAPILSSVMLCFIEPAEAIRVMAECIGRDARRSLLAEVIEAWVDDIPDEELSQHYARAVGDLDHEDLSMLAAWHATLEVALRSRAPSSSWAHSRASGTASATS